MSYGKVLVMGIRISFSLLILGVWYKFLDESFDIVERIFSHLGILGFVLQTFTVIFVMAILILLLLLLLYLIWGKSM